ARPLGEHGLPLGGAVLQAPAFHIEKFHRAVPVPGDEALGVKVQLDPGSDVREVGGKIRQALFPAACAELDAADQFHGALLSGQKSAPPAFDRACGARDAGQGQSSLSSSSVSMACSMIWSIVSAWRAAFWRSMRALTVSFSRV